MHMMYVDESGDPGYPEAGKWKIWGGSTLFVRVGVIIQGWKWKVWDDRLKSFKRNRGLSWDSEMKASHIRQGKGTFAGKDKPTRDFLMGEILDLIGGNENITLIGIVIDKTKVNVSGKDRVVKPEIRSMELLLERYNGFLGEQKDKCGIVVLDPTEQPNDDNVRYFQQYLQAHSKHLQPLHIVEGTFFAKSHTSNMIQIADVCANIFYRKQTGAKGANKEFNKIYGRFWRRNSRVRGYGIKKWP